jgi:hypothetical protein
MQTIGLYITLQQLKLKVTKVTQTRFNIRLVERLEVSKAKGLTKEAWHKFYCKLENMYTQHKYPSNQIWNSNKIGIQAG